MKGFPDFIPGHGNEQSSCPGVDFRVSMRFHGQVEQNFAPGRMGHLRYFPAVRFVRKHGKGDGEGDFQEPPCHLHALSEIVDDNRNPAHGRHSCRRRGRLVRLYCGGIRGLVEGKQRLFLAGLRSCIVRVGGNVPRNNLGRRFDERPARSGRHPVFRPVVQGRRGRCGCRWGRVSLLRGCFFRGRSGGRWRCATRFRWSGSGWNRIAPRHLDGGWRFFPDWGLFAPCGTTPVKQPPQHSERKQPRRQHRQKEAPGDPPEEPALFLFPGGAS